MKTHFCKRIAWSILLIGSLSVTSCIDNNIDLDHLSEDIWLGGNIDAPVLASSTLRMDSLLKRINQPESKTRIAVGIDDVVTLYYDGDTEDYDRDEINDDFHDFGISMEDLSIPSLFANNEVVKWLLDNFGEVAVPNGAYDPDPVLVDVSSVFNDATKKIDHIDFKNVDIVVKFHTNIELKTSNLLTVTLEIPQLNAQGQSIAPKQLLGYLNQGAGETTVSFPNQSFIMDCTKDIQVIYKILGDNQTLISSSGTISASISFLPNDYVVWGWFNFTYSFDTPIKTAAVTAEMEKYLSEESKLIFANPRIFLDVNSSIGADLAFDLISMTTYYKDGDSLKIDRMNNPLPLPNVDAATTPGISQQTPEVLFDKNLNGLTDDQKDAFVHMFSTQLDSLSVNYKVRTARTDLENMTMENIQFIASDSRVTVKTNAELPFTLQAGSKISYTETVETDFGKDVDVTETTTVALYLVYTNTLPIDVNVNIYCLDENKQVISNIAPWTLELKAGEEQKVYELAPVKIKDYVDAKYLNFEYVSQQPITSEISIKGSNFLKIQVGTKLKGGANINGNKE